MVDEPDSTDVPASGKLDTTGWASVLDVWGDSVELEASTVVDEPDSERGASEDSVVSISITSED